MARKLAAALVLAGLAPVVVLLLMQDRGTSRARARETGAADEPAAPAVEERGSGGEEKRPARAPETATIGGTVSGESGGVWGVRIFAVAGEDLVADTGTDVDGRYEVEVPADRDIVLEVRPDPATRLRPQSRSFRLDAGERVVQDFTLDSPPAASGRVEGLAADENVTLLAIRSEDLPALPDDPLARAAALDAAPKLRATTRGGPFRFTQLDPTATYGLLCDGIVWAVKDAVWFRAGDNAVVAQIELVVPVSLEARDMETGEPLRRFRVNLVNVHGDVRDTLEGRSGLAARSSLPEEPPPGVDARAYWRWRGEAQNLLDGWKVVVGADGYHEETFSTRESLRFVEKGGVLQVATTDLAVTLQRIREPNVVIRAEYDDQAPFDGELVGRFGPGLKALLHVRREAPGRFLAAVPAGSWQLDVGRPKVFFDAEYGSLLVVPREGTVDLKPLVFPRTGTVTFESEVDFTVLRAIDGGGWAGRQGATGTFDVPVGNYRVMRGEDIVVTFDVQPGGHETVKVPRFR